VHSEAPDADAVAVRIVIGPVSAAAARGWTAHMVANLRAIRPRRDRMPFRLPDEVADAIEALLVGWHDHALVCGDVFEAVEEIDDDEVRLLVRYWANLDSLTDEQVAALGVDWSSPANRPFFEALANGVARALAGDGESGGSDAFAELLVGQVDKPPRSAHSTCCPA
jgi:hypothetical protein